MRAMRQGPMLVVAFVLVLSALASPAVAQPWRGVALDSLALGAGGNAQFPDGGSIYGLEVFKNLSFLTAGVEAGIAVPEEDGDSRMQFGANVGMNIPGFQQPNILLAPVAGVFYSPGTDDQDFDLITVPIGVAAAYSIPVSPGMAVAPYVIPRFVWARVSADGESESDSEFGWVAGGNLTVENLFFGASYQKTGDADGSFGVNAGILFGG